MPNLSTQQSYMDTWEGHAPALDSSLILRNMIFSPRYLVKTASYTLTAKETGTVIMCYGGTAAVVITLPAISTGPWHFRVLNGQAQDITITSETADTIIGFNDLDLDSVAVTAAGSEIGAHFIIDCDGTKLFVVNALSSKYQATVQND